MAKKKRKWYKVTCPKVFGTRELGEIVSNEPKNIIGRVLTVNAKELTGDFKKSHISIKLIIKELSGDTALTEVKGYEVSRGYLQRFIHKGLSSIDIIHDLETSDKHRIRVRCMATANGKVQTTKKKLLREKFIKELEKVMNNMTLDNIIFISTTNKIQKTLSNRLKKTHPLRFVEIRKIKVLERSAPEAKKANA